MMTLLDPLAVIDWPYQALEAEIRPVVSFDPLISPRIEFILNKIIPFKIWNAQFQLYLLWTKVKLPQLDGVEIASAYSAPRIIRLEYKLNQLSKENKPLEDILTEIRACQATTILAHIRKNKLKSMMKFPVLFPMPYETGMVLKLNSGNPILTLRVISL